MARTSNGAASVEGVDISVEASLFQDHIFTNNQTMSSHFLQRGKNAVHVLVRIHEDDDYRKLSPGIDQVAGLNPVPAKKPRHRVNCGCRVYVFLAQVIEDLHVQRPVMPLVGFVEIDRDLNSHRVWHFTALAPEPCRLAPPPSITNCW